MRLSHAASPSEWVTLGEASRMLGIAPATLRRWSDAGRVRAFTTPGGHRRYRRSALERLIPTDRSERPSLVRSGMTTSRVVRAYREEARVASRESPWLIRLDDTQRDWFRQHGHRLTSDLLTYLDADGPIVTERQLGEAIAEAAAYGRVAAGLGLSLSQAVEAFLQFRRPFLRQLSLVARQRRFDTEATVELMESAEAIMDRLLIAAMAAHRSERPGTGDEGDPPPARRRSRRTRASEPLT
jgi:excisionase family DNA binding protein